MKGILNEARITESLREQKNYQLTKLNGFQVHEMTVHKNHAVRVLFPDQQHVIVAKDEPSLKEALDIFQAKAAITTKPRPTSA